MRTVLKFTLACLIICSTACTKSETAPTEVCYECTDGVSNTASLCEEDGVIYVDGDEIDNPNNLTLQDFVNIVHENPLDDPELEGLICSKK